MIEPLLQRALQLFPVVVVTGARQTGKTTLVRELCPGPPRTYYTFDQIDVMEQARHNPDSLLQRLPVTLDEVQRVPTVLLAVKRLVDRERINGGILLTGSANLALQQNVSETLAGRAIYLELAPLCPAECRQEAPGFQLLDRLFDEDFDYVEWSHAATDWRARLRAGGYPPAMALTDQETRNLWFAGYVQTYLERDLRQLSNIGNLGDFQRLMRLAANRTARILNESALARDAGLTQPSTHRYLQLLEAGYQICRLEPFTVNATTGLKKARKLFWTDCGLGHWLSGGGSDLQGKPDEGFWLEQSLFQTLQVWKSLEPAQRRLYFWHIEANREVDFVLETARGVVGVEVKLSQQVGSKEMTGLLQLAKTIPPSRPFLRGIVLHGGTEARPLGDNCFALPWAPFF